MRDLIDKYPFIMHHQSYTNSQLRALSIEQMEEFVDDILEDVYLYYHDHEYRKDLGYVYEHSMNKLLVALETVAKRNENLRKLYSDKYSKYVMFQLLKDGHRA